MQYSHPNYPMKVITNLYRRVSLNEDEEGGLVFEHVEEREVHSSKQWCLVGRFLTDRLINSHAMKGD